jgi:pimeloyl-ACP methyl ester carboxylesterase
MPSIDIAGVPTWWDVHGGGAPLVLLHPGGADSRAFDDNLPGLAARFRVYRFDRRGHGRTPDPGGPITFEQMARDAIAFVETQVGEPVHLAGHSDGAVVGLLAARLRPDLVRGLVFSSGVFHHDGWLPGVLELPQDAFDFLAGLHAEVAPEPSFGALMAKLDRMHAEEPALTPDDLARIAIPALLVFGDDDEIAMEHVIAMHRALPRAQLAIVPGGDHGHPSDDPERFASMVARFLEAC